MKRSYFQGISDYNKLANLYWKMSYLFYKHITQPGLDLETVV